MIYKGEKKQQPGFHKKLNCGMKVLDSLGYTNT